MIRPSGFLLLLSALAPQGNPLPNQLVSWGAMQLPPGAPVKEIAAGGGSTLALREDGSVVQWGYNDTNGIKMPSSIQPASAIFAGPQRFAALKDSALIPWGWLAPPKEKPILGGGIQTAALSGLAVIVSGTVKSWPAGTTLLDALTPVKAIATGSGHGIALLEDGTLKMWGRVEARAGLPSGRFKAVSAGDDFTLALTEDGVVKGWGELSYGHNAFPADLKGVKAMAAGSHHFAALKEDGTVALWGIQGYDTVTAAGFSHVKSITAGDQETAALLEDGTIVVLGTHRYGIHLFQHPATYYDDAYWENDTWTPEEERITPSLMNVRAVVAGSRHALALKEDGSVVGWGRNDAHQIDVPAGLSHVKAVAAGYDFSLALKEDGTVAAWGRNWKAQLDIPGGLTHVKAVAAGGYHALALKEDGTVVAWGDSANLLDKIPAGLTQVTSIAAGPRFSAALTSDGTLVAWGDTTMKSLYESAKGSKGNVVLAAGETHIVTLDAEGRLHTYGYGPIEPFDLGKVKAVAAGAYSTMALLEDGTVRAWGQNDERQLTIPVDLDHVTAIALGTHFAVAIRQPAAVVTRPAAGPVRRVPLLQGSCLTVSEGAVASVYDLRGKWLRRIAVPPH